MATVFAALVLGYLLLLIPGRSGREAAELSDSVTKQSFVWNRDAYWQGLEEKYRELRQAGCAGMTADVPIRMEELRQLLERIDAAASALMPGNSGSWRAGCLRSPR